MSRKTLMSVDDEVFITTLTRDSLEDGFDVDTANSGIEALERMRARRPDILLLDINMPGMNGIEVCRKVREEFGDVFVVFLSGNNTTESRLDAYQAGADDFIAKPFEVEELQGKMRAAARNLDSLKAARANASEATKVALTAMSSMGEMGAILNFARESLQCANLDALADLLLGTMSSRYDLPSAVQIRTRDQVLVRNSEGRYSPIIGEILTQYASSGKRIVEYGHRLVISYPQVSLIVRDLPIENAELTGRIRDNVAILVEYADVCVSYITVREKLETQRHAMHQALTRARGAVAEIDSEYKQQQSTAMSAFSTLKDDIDRAFINLALTDGQERQMMNIVNGASDKILASYDAGLAIDKRFAEVIAMLLAASEG